MSDLSSKWVRMYTNRAFVCVFTAAPTNEANIPVLLSVAPLGRVPMTKEHDYQYQMLQVSKPSQSEAVRPCRGRCPCRRLWQFLLPERRCHWLSRATEHGAEEVMFCNSAFPWECYLINFVPFDRSTVVRAWDGRTEAACGLYDACVAHR